MELCTARGTPTSSILNHPKHFATSHVQFQSVLRCKTIFPFLQRHTRLISGSHYYRDSSLRSTSEETSAGTTPYVEDEPKPDSIITEGDIALWLLAAVVSAVDSISSGLGYTLWFSSRYLVFKKNRDELVAKIEQIKQQHVALARQVVHGNEHVRSKCIPGGGFKLLNERQVSAQVSFKPLFLFPLLYIGQKCYADMCGYE
ncbi:protein CURVATURE THYLAKOID 1D, chloroplastic [Sesamum angolense]|uniref:Protein CURVATURE THYLAKOID 1D, chloroplastic n=1 Tax=Sesamum angolense TaxID=2727404 RepID=A0AAE1XHV0_9LAMI|nr:protein CURVATURE THYLAKOID 1D, chloroplastic [Sesamum angolense]